MGYTDQKTSLISLTSLIVAVVCSLWSTTTQTCWLHCCHFLE